jgi:mRNA interferase MazF
LPGKGERTIGRKNKRKEIHIKKIRITYPKRMDVWFADLDYNYNSSVQGGPRPVLIVSNDQNNANAQTVTVLPMTSRMKRPRMPTHTWIEGKYLGGGCLDSMILAEQITTVDKKVLTRKIGELKEPEKIKEIENSMMIQIMRGETE